MKTMILLIGIMFCLCECSQQPEISTEQKIQEIKQVEENKQLGNKLASRIVYFRDWRTNIWFAAIINRDHFGDETISITAMPNEFTNSGHIFSKDITLLNP